MTVNSLPLLCCSTRNKIQSLQVFGATFLSVINSKQSRPRRSPFVSFYFISFHSIAMCKRPKRQDTQQLVDAAGELT